MPAAADSGRAQSAEAQARGRQVCGMFAAIAPRYDLLNRLLSLGQDQRWRRVMVSRLPTIRNGDRLLDVCTGTGDVALALQRRHGELASVHGSDFCEAMVNKAPAKSPAGSQAPRYLVADALALPYASGQFRALTVAFGLRNVQDPERALHELARVLQPEGRLLILEFARPRQRAFAALYRFYFFQILPRLGRLLSSSPGDAYRYLPESVWAFAGPEQLAAALRAAGLRVLEQKPLLCGAVILHVAERPAA
ncbi:MAG: ubiquinone/menaquinone biosynthesis methyltransferase [Planctomycetota bacterium]